jgi:hypothetical protein
VGVTAAARAITLPLRVPSAMRAGVAVSRRVLTERRPRNRKRDKHGQRRTVTELRSAARVRYGDHATIVGRLTNKVGQPLAALPVQVIELGFGGERLLATLSTDSTGRYRYRVAGSASRALRFAFSGSALVLPSQAQVTLTVPAAGRFKPSRQRLANGGRLVFRGRVLSGPLPAAGKLVELQVRQPTGEWTTFRTVRTDAAGRWSLPYRFSRVRCHSRYRIRAVMPVEAGYPFATGRTRARSVLVRGAAGPCS